MSAATRYRQLPAPGRAVGFELETPVGLELVAGEANVRVSEQRDGKPVGELEVAVFHAALVIDRDGILEEKVREGIERAIEAGAHVLETVPYELGGASGYRADAGYLHNSSRPALPYVYVFAIAPDDLGVDAGVRITVRSASSEWPAADEILKSLKLLCRRSASNDIR